MEKVTTTVVPKMQQCANCQYFVPKGYLSCPQCSMPLAAGAAAPQTVYTGKAGKAKGNPTALVVGIAVALVAVVAVTLVARGGGEKELVGADTLAAPVNDGWRNFTAPDGAFTVSFPGIPERGQNAIGSLNEVAQGYSMKDGAFEFGVVVSPAPAYTPPHQAGEQLAAWMRPIYEGQGGVVEAAAQLVTPRGDQAFDLVVVNGGVRNWLRFTTWNGSIIRVYASLPADKQPTPAQSQTYSRLRDSVHR
ncbi:MAG: hypothetical protein ABI658_03395 [Acidimicrobiales bacterium]